jgi:Protein of unknown function (DUF1579)
MHESPSSEHQWLERLVGEWTFEAQCSLSQDQPPVTGRGSERVKSLGMWVVCEGEGEMSEGCLMRSIMTLGFDPKKGRFVGTFIASPMTHLWQYDGTLDAGQTLLTLDTEGPSFFKEGAMSRYRDLVELLPDGRRRLRSQLLADDGRWREFNCLTYTRIR